MPLRLQGPYGLGPPADLIARVTEQFGVESGQQARIDFFPKAVAHVRHHERALQLLGHEFADFGRILDFGCGPGRLTRLLTELSPDVEVHGVDVDAELVAWADANIPEAQFVAGPHVPPLPYPDGFFDLVVNHSVFTHLDAEHQDLWLAELRRITRPGGLLLLTIHSTRQLNAALADMSPRQAARGRDELESHGILFIADDTFVGTTHPDWYHTAFHAPWYVLEHWSAFFEVRALIAEGSDTQDLVVLRRPDDPPDPLAAPLRRSGVSPGVVPAAAEPGPAPSDADSTDELATVFRTEDEYTSLLERAASTDDHRALQQDALNAARATAARVDALAREVSRLRDVLGANVVGLGALRDELVDRDRVIGVLRAALDEQAQRTASAIAELRSRVPPPEG